MGIGDRDAERSRKQDEAQQERHDEGADGEVEQRMRLMGMRRRQVQRKAERQSQAGARIPEGNGTPLGREVRARFEGELGADLSRVKVHTGGESAAAAEKLGARAFTTGSDVHFGARQFAPGTKEGDRLLAHELTHVVQGQQSGVQRKAEPDREHGDGSGEAHGAHDADVSQPGEPAEQEADAVADHVADKLHDGKGDGGKDKVDGAKDHGGAPKQKPGAIAAKLDGGGRKVLRSVAPRISAQLPSAGARIFRKWIEFKDLSAKEKGPTADPSHPHLKEMGIKALGPYKYFPAKGEFQYTPPTDLKDLWTDTEDGKSYEPEAPAAPQAQAKAADKKARQAKAKQKFGPGLDAILAHDNGKTPRPFTSVVDEDTRGAGLDAHNVQRHCVSGASEMKSKQDVALRAGFGMIGGAVKGVYTSTASAFESVTAANTAIAAPLNKQMAGSWTDWRTQLAAGKNAFSPVIGAGCSGAIVFKSVSGAPLNVDQVPKYLGLDPSHKGIGPLWAGDARWQQWWDTNPQERKDYEKANGPKAKPPAITSDASSTATGVSMRVLAEPTLTNGGWILHSAYPTT
ncbi:MAG: hypothetical protein JWM53_987 [bacterium]|nr:hypothetical protein [bacterium]